MNECDLYLSSELYHHGIQGQKWGVRNGPPYIERCTSFGGLFN